eukprot:CAMPEP_0114261038 /NCGR_PEP_ID=MMETSP0058-20121206/20874_1 /TAXON_ID=36894 /ORGANISM="Pyramimonas parkeae, CCMP726" /LENGTH=118 /DNA_ID=CAMNT_0001376447 /DNA_START=94 /DNA_END=450 /DNA_ORIENTATION=+
MTTRTDAGVVVEGEEEEDEEEETEEGPASAEAAADQGGMRTVYPTANQIKLHLSLRQVKSAKRDMTTTVFERTLGLLRGSSACLQRSTSCVKDVNHLMRQAAQDFRTILEVRPATVDS